MPLYDYRCDSCGHEFEANRPVQQRDEAECPKCRSPKVGRLFRASGVISSSSKSGGSGSCSPTRSGFG